MRLTDAHIMQEILGKRRGMICGIYHPGQHSVRIDFAYPGNSTNPLEEMQHPGKA